MKIIDKLLTEPKHLKEYARIVINEPLVKFYELLGEINHQYFRNEPIEATKTLQWKAGIYDKSGQLINRILFLNKKPKNIAHHMQRAYDKSNYDLRWIIRRFNILEELRAKIRSNKLTNEEVETQSNRIIETVTEKLKKLTDAVDEINDVENSKISCVVGYDGEENWAHTYIHIRFFLRDLNFIIYTGKRDEPIDNDYKIAEYKYPDLVEVKFSFRLHDLTKEKISRSIQIRGYLTAMDSANNVGRLRHPYLSHYARNTSFSHNVCLDMFQADAFKMLDNGDLPSLARLLLEWSQFYHMTRGNPYNHIKYCIEGYPESVREIMHELAPGDGTECANILSARLGLASHFITPHHSDEMRDDYTDDDAQAITNKCNDIGCIFKDKCRVYKVLTTPIAELTEEELAAKLERESIEAKIKLERFHRGG